MNKYQEALNWLRETTISLEHNQAYNILQELVDKETPMKPTKNDKTNLNCHSRLCPNCGLSLFFKGAGCINNDCRQKIDWSNDNE